MYEKPRWAPRRVATAAPSRLVQTKRETVSSSAKASPM